MNHGDHNPNDPHASLKIPKKAPLLDRKPFTTDSSSKSNSAASNAATNQPPCRRPPIIIYTHPPRVYHTTPSGFKELVQKLTGKPKSSVKDADGSSNSTNIPAPPLPPEKKPDQLPVAPPDGSPSMSAGDSMLVGVQNAASSTSLSSQPPSSNSIVAEASPAFEDDADLYSPPLKTAKLDKDASWRSSDLDGHENFACPSPRAASPLYDHDPPESASSFQVEIPPSIWADNDLDSPPSAKKSISVTSGLIVDDENMDADGSPLSPSSSLIENPFAVSFLDLDVSNLSIFPQSISEESNDDGTSCHLMLKRKQR